MNYIFCNPGCHQHSPNYHPPLNIIFPGAHYERLGNEVSYFDLRIDSQKDLYKSISNADVFAISTMTTPSMLKQAIQLLKKSKEINPNIKTMIGGPHAKAATELCRKADYIDEVCIDNVGLKETPFTDKTKRFFTKQYFPMWFTSINCPFSCNFCAIEHKWWPRPKEQTLMEMQQIIDWSKSKKIVLADPNIGMGTRLDWIGKFMRDNDIEYYSNLRNDYMTKKVIGQLDRGNCTRLEMGCESGSDRILKDIINKRHNVETTRTAIRNLVGTNISPMCSFMVRNPTETYEEVVMSMDLVDWIMKTLPIARCSFFTYTPYPGTPMMKMAVEYQGFIEPTSNEGWAENKLDMSDHPLYWIGGLNFRKENTSANFPGKDREKIAPYEKMAAKCWKTREWKDFPSKEVSKIVQKQSEDNLIKSSCKSI